MRQAMLAVVVLSAAVLVSVTTAGASSGSGRNGRVLYSEAYQYAYGSGFLYAINPNGSWTRADHQQRGERQLVARR